MNYFNPANLVKHEATFNYVAKSGVGFAVNKDSEQVFISARDVDTLQLNVGDAIRVWAVDNHAAMETAHYPSRWRAVRVELVQRLDTIVRDTPNTPVIPVTVTAPTTSLDVNDLLESLMEDPRPWTTRELAQAMTKANPELASISDLQQKVTNRLNSTHKTGRVALLKVYGRGDQSSASAVYYAKNVDVFYDYLETPLNDAE